MACYVSSMAVVVAVVVVIPGTVVGILQLLQTVVADIDDLVQQLSAVHLGFFIDCMADVAARGRAVLVTAAYGKQSGRQQKDNGQRQGYDSFHGGSSMWWFQ